MGAGAILEGDRLRCCGEPQAETYRSENLRKNMVQRQAQPRRLIAGMTLATGTPSDGAQADRLSRHVGGSIGACGLEFDKEKVDGNGGCICSS